ncbi:hypothetical protein [Chitinilyticum litopenaei]|uniref:hypothetical protein n=1 Tax=Chitinilyticum litopenaei TaxID=1121276 RepID=UPI00040AC77E|nr:hypothetical protein [Chitinilyticum litopenaei]
MMIARWSIDVRFGHKAEAVALMQQWLQDIGSQIGWTPDRVRLLNGSLGANESLLVSELEIADLAELDAAWAKLAQIDAHRDWGKALEAHIVSGTPRWEVFRVL